MQLAEQAIEKGSDYLIAVGGDGMLNEVVNGYMQTTKEKRKEVVIGALPYGTGNDFVKSVGITNDLEQIARLMETHKAKPVDLDRKSVV